LVARSARPALLVLAAALVLACGCRKAAAPLPPTQVVAVPVSALPLEPDDPAWQSVPEYPAKLILQDMVEPRQLAVTTGEVRVRAVTSGSQIAFRLGWTDASQDDVADSARFADACAVQLPAKTEPTVPAPQMGEPGRPVEITFWNACWQAIANGRGQSIRDLYPHATVDHYPFEAKPLENDPAAQSQMALRYAPALALGNRMASPGAEPVQDLVADGPGTLAPAPSSRSRGKGRWDSGAWAVVIARPLPAGFSPEAGSQVAFAVWEGAHQEVGARKMRTAWIPLTVAENP
jgi:DMSO reductase family type II enzyme heme b subunit